MKSKKPSTINKYDAAIRTSYLIFYSIGAIIFLTVGLQRMELWIWAISFVYCLLGATAYGTVAKIIITLIRKDQKNKKKAKAKSILKLSYLVIFSIATIIFISIGIEHNDPKSWLISFIATYGGAVVYSAIARLIITLTQKNK